MGEPFPDRLAASMTMRQLREWMAYYEVEPWGEDRADLRAGIIAATTANVWRGRGPAAKPSDFMPRFDGPAKQSQQEMHEIFAAYAAAHNAAQGARRGNGG